MSDNRFVLRVVRGPKAGLTIPLDPSRPVLIGRNRGDLVVEDPLVSGAHCRIVFRGDRYVVQDLGSTNGTVVDGRRVQDAPLRAGAEVVLGGTTLLMCEAGPARPVTPNKPRRELAWLCVDELVPERAGDTANDLIGQGLRRPPGLQGSVKVIAGPDHGRVLALAHGTVTIGRRQGEVALSDPEVSRRHAYLEVFGHDMVFLRDVASTNGTFHNGRRVDVARVVHGDTIGVGKTVMRLSLGVA